MHPSPHEVIPFTYAYFYTSRIIFIFIRFVDISKKVFMHVILAKILDGGRRESRVTMEIKLLSEANMLSKGCCNEVSAG